MNPKSVDVSLKSVRINETTVRPPYPIKEHLLNEQKLYLMLYTDQKPSCKDPDFQLPSEDRNVVALGNCGQVEWVIETVPGANEESHHQNFFSFRQCYFTRHTDGNVRFNLDTGEILEILPKNQLLIGSERIKLSGEAFRVCEFENAIFVRCRDADHALYAFETDGTERWKSEKGKRRGLLSVEDGELWERKTTSRTTDYRYRIDPETGERLSKEKIDTGLWG